MAMAAAGGALALAAEVRCPKDGAGGAHRDRDQAGRAGRLRWYKRWRTILYGSLEDDALNLLQRRDYI